MASLALSCNSSSPPSERTSPSEQTSPSVASFVRVRLPEGVNRADLKSPSAVVRKKLDAALAEQLSSAPVQATTDVVVYEDAQGDVLCHELIHAFRDDYGIGLSSWEEGMTRAVEIEVMKACRHS